MGGGTHPKSVLSRRPPRHTRQACIYSAVNQDRVQSVGTERGPQAALECLWLRKDEFVLIRKGKATDRDNRLWKKSLWLTSLKERGKRQHAGPPGKAPSSLGQETEGANEKVWTRAFIVVSEGRKGQYRAEKFEQVQDWLVWIILRLWAIRVSPVVWSLVWGRGNLGVVCESLGLVGLPTEAVSTGESFAISRKQLALAGQSLPRPRGPLRCSSFIKYRN